MLNAFDEIGVAPLPACSSLDTIASTIRQSITAYRSSANHVRRSVAFKIASFDSLALRGWWLSWREPYLLLSNWRSARLAEMDWSAAAATLKDKETPDAPTTPLTSSLVLPFIQSNGQAVRGLVWVVGEDKDNIWITVVLGRKAWRSVLRNMEKAGCQVL